MVEIMKPQGGQSQMSSNSTSGTRDRPVNLRRLAFLAPLAGYWLLAVAVIFHSRPWWVLWTFGPPLVLIAAAILFRPSSGLTLPQRPPVLSTGRATNLLMEGGDGPRPA
jgi:hypothetical protein